MNLKDRLGGDEARLKVLVDRLSAATGTTAPALVRREEALSALVAQLAETRLFLDDFLSGRSAHERAVLLYKIRVEYPLFSHLDALASLSSEFVDWSANDFSLTPASPQ